MTVDDLSVRELGELQAEVLGRAVTEKTERIEARHRPDAKPRTTS